jgi:hypothetical protein
MAESAKGEDYFLSIWQVAGEVDENADDGSAAITSSQ